MSAPMALHGGGTLAGSISEVATIRERTDRSFAIGFITDFTPFVEQLFDLYKRLIVESDGGDTVFTHAYDIVSGLSVAAGHR
jgi:hypothetical protein